MVKEGFPFVIVPLVLALIFGFFQIWIVAALFVLLAAFMAFFFRDPHREVPQGNDIIISAADGRVTRIDESEAGKLVSVFLSPIDVHINRAPIAGKITKASGKFAQKLHIEIPKEVYSPAGSCCAQLNEIKATLGATFKKAGKAYKALQTTACPKGAASAIARAMSGVELPSPSPVRNSAGQRTRGQASA